ncbi:MAG: class I SAM-dependent methyltransferase [Mariprofundaceae bacterium]
MRRIYLPFGKKEARPGMGASQRQRLIERHQASLSHFGYSTEALFWESRGVQKVRFKTLAEIGIPAGDSLLDVGCGFADLYSWLQGYELPVIYTGIDLSQEILDKGIEMNPKLDLLQGEIFDFDWQAQRFDWVFLSGTLNWNLHDDGEYARRVIREMFRLARLGVAFNMLDNRDLDAAMLQDLCAYDREEIFSFCKEIAPDSQLITGYHDNDFTIYLRRSA